MRLVISFIVWLAILWLGPYLWHIFDIGSTWAGFPALITWLIAIGGVPGVILFSGEEFD